jgi:4'-phosphopantetheinyl transferase
MSWAAAPEHPRAGEEVHVWRAALDDPGWPGPTGLPTPERRRAAGFLSESAARRWTAARWALRGVLARYLGQAPGAIEIEPTETGKPRLAGSAGRLEFNLSHSGELALVAVARAGAVGVDVERVEPDRDLLALAERALRVDAARAVKDADPAARGEIFYREWTRHEARLKCLGVGLAGADSGVAVDTADLDPGPGYAAAVAFSGELGTLRCWALPPG